MALTFQQFDELSTTDFSRASGAEFGTLLDSVPVEDRVKAWTKITPVMLWHLSEDAMEALFDRLPQCGAIAGRERGKLRVLSMGFNVHIAGTDRRVPYPFDFCVRINGYEAAVNVLVLVKPEKFSLGLLDGLSMGPGLSFYDAVRRLRDRGIASLDDFEVALLRMYRPASPGPDGYQYGTAGGVFEGPGDTARDRSLQETKQEFRGFEYLAWDLVLNQEAYQAGNIYELHSAGVVLGHLPDRSKVETSKPEAIEDWITVPLDRVFNFFDQLRRVSPGDPTCIRHDSKIDHALRIIIPKMTDCGIR